MCEVPLYSSSLVSHPPCSPLNNTSTVHSIVRTSSSAPRRDLAADGKHAVRAVGPSDVLRLQVPAKGHHRAGVMPSSPSAESYAQLGCGAVSLRREGASAKMQTTWPRHTAPFPALGWSKSAGWAPLLRRKARFRRAEARTIELRGRARRRPCRGGCALRSRAWRASCGSGQVVRTTGKVSLTRKVLSRNIRRGAAAISALRCRVFWWLGLRRSLRSSL